MKITYLFHDCFLLECGACVLLTDYFSGVPVDPRKMMAGDLPSYLLVSHHHKDHFTPAVFSWWRQLGSLRYIVSRDVASRTAYLMSDDSHYRGRNRVDASRVAVLGLHDVFEAPGLRIEAFGSTDIGNSYMIETEGKRIFFAGDLNAWTWCSESTPQEVAQSLDAYLAVLDDIYKRYRSFDVVLFPVDPRMRPDAVDGGRLFCEKFEVGNFVPMHFELWSDPAERDDYLDFVLGSRDKIVGTRGTRYIPLLQTGDSVEF